MPLHDKAFWAICSFLGGVLVGSGLEEWDTRWIAALLIALFLGLGIIFATRLTYAIFAITFFVGVSYYFLTDARTKNIRIPFGEVTTFEGEIKDIDRTTFSQTLTINLFDPHKGRVRATIPRYPKYHHGDQLKFEGTITKPDERSARFLKKDRIAGTMRSPKTELVESGGVTIKGSLFALKERILDSFNKTLPPQEAAFLGGVTLGETSGFTKEFREQMSITGTSHMVALSGYNIAIIAQGVLFALGKVFRRRIAFALGVLIIVFFVIMAGAEASVVRAAIMGVLVLLADQVARVYSFRNAIAIAAFLMVLQNPYLLRFDVGFQLSFAAVMGLVYLEPALRTWFRIKRKDGILFWRKNFWTTLSAQFAVLPILLANFGAFSPISLLVNVLVLLAIPLIMFLGFIIAGLGFILPFLAQVVAWLAHIPILYALGLIDWFAGKNIAQFTVSHFGLPLIVLYYLCLGGLIVMMQRKEKQIIYGITF